MFANMSCFLKKIYENLHGNQNATYYDIEKTVFVAIETNGG